MRTLVRHGLLVLLLAGCGASALPATTEPVAERPSGPPLSHLSPAARVVGRIDVAHLRRSGLGEAFEAVAATSEGARLRRVLGLDPITDIDALLIGCESFSTDRCVLVLRHPHDEPYVREHALAIASPADARAAWRYERGLPTIDWPMAHATGPYALSVTAPHELVLAPAADLDRVAAAAHDHAERRAHGREGALDPGLTSGRASELATLVIGVPFEVPVDGAPPPARHTRVQLDERPDGGIDLELRATFASESDAARAGAWLEEQRTFLMRQAMIGMFRLDEALTEATVNVVGTGVAIAVHFAADSAAVLGRFLAFGLTMLLAPPPPVP